VNERPRVDQTVSVCSSEAHPCVLLFVHLKLYYLNHHFIYWPFPISYRVSLHAENGQGSWDCRKKF